MSAPTLLVLHTFAQTGGADQVTVGSRGGGRHPAPADADPGMTVAGAQAWKANSDGQRIKVRVIVTHPDFDALPGKLALHPVGTAPMGEAPASIPTWDHAHNTAGLALEEPGKTKTVYRNSTAAAALTNGSTDSAAMSTFYAQTAPGVLDRVRMLRSTWAVWWRSNATTTWHHLGEAAVDVFGLLGPPSDPWASADHPDPWIEVLRWAARWADGKDTVTKAAREVYDLFKDGSGLTYDTGATAYVATDSAFFFTDDNYQLKLGLLLEQMDDSSVLGSHIDCRGMATAVQTFGNALGLGLCRLQWQQVAMTINHRLDLAATAHEESEVWGYHQFAYEETPDRVYDPCTDLDRWTPQDEPFTRSESRGILKDTFEFRLLEDETGLDEQKGGTMRLIEVAVVMAASSPPSPLLPAMSVNVDALLAGPVLRDLVPSPGGTPVPGSDAWFPVHFVSNSRGATPSLHVILASGMGGPPPGRWWAHRLEIVPLDPSSSTPGEVFDQMVGEWPIPGTAVVPPPDLTIIAPIPGEARGMSFGDHGSIYEIPGAMVVAHSPGGTIRARGAPRTHRPRPQEQEQQQQQIPPQEQQQQPFPPQEKERREPSPREQERREMRRRPECPPDWTPGD